MNRRWPAWDLISNFLGYFFGVEMVFSNLKRKPFISAIDYIVFGESRENHFLNPSVFVGFPILIFILSALLYTTITNHPVIAS